MDVEAEAVAIFPGLVFLRKVPVPFDLKAVHPDLNCVEAKSYSTQHQFLFTLLAKVVAGLIVSVRH